jgi:hypothetical protein
MADWSTISSLATAGGTLVLAVATFSSVRSANRSARTAERAFQVGLRPVLMPSRLEDPPEKMTWIESRWTTVLGGRGSVEVDQGVVYLAMSLRNVGSGIAVVQAWHVSAFTDAELDAFARQPRSDRSHPPLEEFRRQGRDLYIPAGDKSFWQGALRDADDPVYRPVVDAIQSHRNLAIHLLYSDHEGGQRTISRFQLICTGDDQWMEQVALHWNLDRPDPR